ncbi:MAG: UbiX family flavin prenyltransferase [Chloroflexi bacterium]|nr:UbiX family flavin prenyltransferase [Chloroflexota bacterium]
MRLIVGISGATGAIYGVRLLQILRDLPDVESHLIVSNAARLTIEYETEYAAEEVFGWADVRYDHQDVAAAIASGTFVTAGMVVAPCSMKSLAEIANSLNANLLARAADVCLKERRKLVLVVRETPLHYGHLRLMTEVTLSGAVVLPPVPGFYHRPKTILDLVDHTITKVLDQFGLDAALMPRWQGLPPPEA